MALLRHTQTGVPPSCHLGIIGRNGILYSPNYQGHVGLCVMMGGPPLSEAMSAFGGPLGAARHDFACVDPLEVSLVAIFYVLTPIGPLGVTWRLSMEIL